MPAKRRRLPPGFRRKAIALLLFGGIMSLYLGVAMDPRSLALGIVVLAVLVIGFCFPFVQARAVRGVWDFVQRRGQVGRKLEIQLQLTNRWLPAGALVVFADDVLPVREQSAVMIPLLAGFRRSSVDVSVVPARRGVYSSDRRASLVTGFPFGFAHARRLLQVTGKVLIWPATIPLKTTGRSASHAAFAADLADSRQPGTSGQVSGARPYRQGESLRRIHWPQTARLDRLIVCERSRPEASGATIFVDTDPSVYGDDDEQVDLEFAISLGASFAEGYVRQGRQVTLLSGNRRAWHLQSPASLTQLLDGLASLDPEQSVPLRELLASRAGSDAEDSTELVITSPAGLDRVADLVRDRARIVVVDQTAPAYGGRHEAAGVYRVPPSDLRDDQLQRLAEELLHGG